MKYSLEALQEKKENKMDRVSIGEIEPEAYEPVAVPVKDIKRMIKTNAWEGSLEQEEVLYNINEGLYPKDYADEVKKLLGI